MKTFSDPEDSNLPPEQTHELISALCDGSITEEQLRLLETELLQNAESREIYAAILEQEASLEWELSTKEALIRIRRDEVETHLGADGVGTDSGQPLGNPVSVAPRPAARWMIAAAVLIVGGLTVWSTVFRAPLKGPAGNSPQANVRQAVGGIQGLAEDCMWYVEDLAGSEHANVAVGETLRVVEGEVQVAYESGTTVVLAAPAVFEFTGSNSAKLVHGKLRGQVSEGAEGFIVNTPRASVVDYGTEFGISVDESGATNIAVFEGEVGVEQTDSLKALRLRMGDGVHLDEFGKMSRLVAFESSFFPSEGDAQSILREPLITDIRDNTNQPDNMKYYEIVVGGMREDARAYVDREFHQWNGHTSTGMPDYLLGADYVRMFNNDKINEQIEIEVTVGQPAVVYVFVDDRNNIPGWLSSVFEDTGDTIGLDTGPYRDLDNILRLEDRTTGVGPGESIDGVFSIWQLRVEIPRTLKLGTADIRDTRTNMYALAAVPLE